MQGKENVKEGAQISNLQNNMGQGAMTEREMLQEDHMLSVVSLRDR